MLFRSIAELVEKRIGNLPDKTPSVEQIQDAVEQILIEEDHVKTAKAYILYRAKRTEIRKNELNPDIELDRKSVV